ncbi:MAG TPA: hypothetical protein VNO86_11725 [Candidatus Binatia bacterium]|nr:hypothetical protein [Candidatus Binatia bacterium]
MPPAGRSLLERGLTEGWITRRVDRPPASVIHQLPLAGTPTTTELIGADRDDALLR